MVGRQKEWARQVARELDTEVGRTQICVRMENGNGRPRAHPLADKVNPLFIVFAGQCFETALAMVMIWFADPPATPK